MSTANTDEPLIDLRRARSGFLKKVSAVRESSCGRSSCSDWLSQLWLLLANRGKAKCAFASTYVSLEIEDFCNQDIKINRERTTRPAVQDICCLS